MTAPVASLVLRVPEFLWPLAGRIGLALLHALWEGTLIAALLAAVLAILHRASPKIRYWLSCSAMAALPLAAVVTFAMLPAGRSAVSGRWPAVSVPTPPRAHPLDYGGVMRVAIGAQGADPSVRRSTVDATPASQKSPGTLLALLGMAWVVGVVGISLYRLSGWMYLRKLLSLGTPAGPRWLERLARLRERLEIARPVRLLQSSAVAVPMVAGWLRPIVLLPVSAINNMPVDHIEALLAHELAHVRRHDYLANLIVTAIETAFFYHPLAWWISQQVRREREDCCDDIAAKVTGSPLTYARALAEVEELRLPALGPALAASDGNLLRRVRRILRREDPAPPTGGAAMPLIILLLAVGVWFTFTWPRPSGAEPSTGPTSTHVSGRVLDPQGRPVAGASVLLTRVTNWPQIQTIAVATTKEDGTFGLETRQAGPHEEGEKAGYFAFLPALGMSLSQPLGDGKPVDLRLLPSAELHIPFVGPDGKPIVGMRVWPKMIFIRDDSLPFPNVQLLPPDVWRLWQSRTDAQGVCVFRGLPRSARVLFDDDNERLSEMDANDYVPLERDGVVRAAPVARTLAGVISGSVVYSETNKPVLGVRVMAQSVSHAGGGYGSTNARGRYQIPRLKPGRYVVSLETNDPAWEWVARAVQVDVVAGGRPAADLAMIHGGILTGIVRDQETQKGIPGLQVALHGPARPSEAGAVDSGVADSNGVYRIRVAPGRQSVYLMDEPPDGYLRPDANPFHPRDIVVGDGRIVTLNIDLPPDKSPVVNGIVLGPDGKPVAGATVIYPRDEPDFFDRSITSGPDGRFRARGVRQSAEFRARFNDLATRSPVEYRGDGQELTLRLSRRGIYKAVVRVVDEQGKVVAGASVSLITWHRASGEGSQPHPTGADGTVHFDNLYSDTRYTVTSTTPGRGEASAPIDAPGQDKPGEQLVQLQIVSARDVVAGVVLDEKGRPVSDAEVMLSGTGVGSITTHADANGKFKFSVVSTMRGRLYLPALRNRQGLPIMADAAAGETDIRLVLPSLARDGSAKPATTRPGS